MNILQTAILIAGEVGRTLGIKRVKINPVPQGERVDWLAGHVEAVEALGLRERSWITFQQPALIAEVRDLRAPMDTPPLFYVAVEVSHTGTSEHLFR